MSDTNVYCCTGRLGGDPIKRTFQNGDSVVNFNLAISESWKKDGEKQERTTWLSVTIQNQGLAGIAERYLKKGSRVSLMGKLQGREYEKDGVTHKVIELVLSPFQGSLTLLDGPSGDSQPQRQERTPARSASAHAPAFNPGGMDDDIPFAPEWR